jgi:hypothetical protein
VGSSTPAVRGRSSSGSTDAPVAHSKGDKAQRAAGAKVTSQQDAFVGRAAKIDKSFKELAKTKVSLNAVIARVNAKQLAKLAADPAVSTIRAVRDYELDLSETVPFIGGTAVQDLGVTGEGITVAVLDSGIDLHARRPGWAGQRSRPTSRPSARRRKTRRTRRSTTATRARCCSRPQGLGGFDFRRRGVDRWRGLPATRAGPRPDRLRRAGPQGRL